MCDTLKILVLANNAGGLYGFRGELLQALVLRDYRVFVAVPEPREDTSVARMEAVGCRYIHAPMSRRGVNPLEDIRLIRRYKQIVRTIVPDLILTYTIKPNVYGNYVGSRFGIPVISNVTGIGSSLSSDKLMHFTRRLYKFACNKASIVFFQNQSNVDFFLHKKMVDPCKIRLIPGSGVNLGKFQPMDKRNNDDGITRFLYIGRIMKDKGIDEYLEAANVMTERYPNIEFQILGSFEEDQYRERIGNNPGIKYLGRSDDVREQIRDVDCIVNPSYHEGMSNVLLEGAAMGKPLLASDIPGCREVVDDGINGLLFEPRSADSLAEKLDVFMSLDRSDRGEMGRKSREKVELGFDRNIVVEAYLQAISDILG